jgi:hypothetical protein
MSYGHGREEEPADIRRERISDAAIDVLAAALATRWFDPKALCDLEENQELQREIASKLYRYELKSGTAPWDPEARRLANKWARFVDYDGNAKTVDQESRKAVRDEFVADPATTTDQLLRLLVTRNVHSCDTDVFGSVPCTCWRSIARARVEQARAA